MYRCQVWALSVPKISIDPEGLEPDHAEQVLIRGSISKSKGQKIDLFADDGKTVLARITAGTSGAPEHFQLQVPADYVNGSVVNCEGELTVFVQSRTAKGVTASKKVRVVISCRKLREPQSIKAPERVTLTNLKTTSNLKAEVNTGRELTYRSSKPKVVTVSKTGKLKRKKNGKAVITIRQEGSSAFLPAEKKVTVTSRKSTRQEQIDGAVAWAVAIAKDDSFTYGTGRGAHHFGCYFCGTNFGPRKYMKPSKRYRKTYCCNPFVSAAYAHGAKHPKMLAACRRASGIGMEKWTFYRYGCWKCVGRPAYRKLQKGDVLVSSSHVAMYIGKQKLVEASGGSWSASSIAVRHMSKARYRGFRYVMRYKGY